MSTPSVDPTTNPLVAPSDEQALQVGQGLFVVLGLRIVHHLPVTNLPVFGQVSFQAKVDGDTAYRYFTVRGNRPVRDFSLSRVLGFLGMRPPRRREWLR